MQRRWNHSRQLLPVVLSFQTSKATETISFRAYWRWIASHCRVEFASHRLFVEGWHAGYAPSRYMKITPVFTKCPTKNLPFPRLTSAIKLWWGIGLGLELEVQTTAPSHIPTIRPDALLNRHQFATCRCGRWAQIHSLRTGRCCTRRPLLEPSPHVTLLHTWCMAHTSHTWVKSEQI